MVNFINTHFYVINGMKVTNREELDWILDKCEEMKNTGYVVPDGYWTTVRLLKCPDGRYAVYTVTEHDDGAIDEDAEVFTDYSNAIRAFRTKVLTLIDEVKETLILDRLRPEVREQLEHDLEEMKKAIIET